ncbi:MAG: tRNA pseudouridine(13) synthase TruD, partial [Balneolaceae bacterium]
MREAHPTERAVGIDYYVSDAAGIDGRLRVDPADFQVAEIERVDPESADADAGAYPEVLLRATLRSWDTNDFAGR